MAQERPGVRLTFPGIGGQIEIRWPADKWTTLLLALVACAALVACCHIVFIQASPENVSSFGEAVGWRKPTKHHILTEGDPEVQYLPTGELPEADAPALEMAPKVEPLLP
jgi:hypothetical protein